MAAALALAAAIDSLCAARADRALRGTAVRVGRIVGDPTTTPAAWRRVDASLVARIARDPDIYSEVADVFSEAGSVAIVKVESRSIDFREDATYCFRVDGSLARIASTSSGTINRDDETRYYDPAGTLVGSTSRLGLVYPSAGASISPDVKAATPSVFLTVRSLPFFALLPRRRASRAQRPPTTLPTFDAASPFGGRFDCARFARSAQRDMAASTSRAPLSVTWPLRLRALRSA